MRKYLHVEFLGTVFRYRCLSKFSLKVKRKMSLTNILRNGRTLKNVLPRASQCWYSVDKSGEAGTTDPPASQSSTPKPSVSAQEPFDNTQYKSDVYYQHNDMTFYDIEIACSATRVGQPSSVGHYNNLPKDVLDALEKSC